MQCNNRGHNIENQPTVTMSVDLRKTVWWKRVVHKQTFITKEYTVFFSNRRKENNIKAQRVEPHKLKALPTWQNASYSSVLYGKTPKSRNFVGALYINNEWILSQMKYHIIFGSENLWQHAKWKNIFEIYIPVTWGVHAFFTPQSESKQHKSVTALCNNTDALLQLS